MHSSNLKLEKELQHFQNKINDLEREIKQLENEVQYYRSTKSIVKNENGEKVNS